MTQHKYEGYTTNMLQDKGHQLVYPFSNYMWSRDLDINKKNGKEIVCSTTQHGTEHPWVKKEIVEGNEKGGEMNYNSTGAM